MAWDKLIENWCEVKGRYGLTIPFLVGVERLNNETTIKSLLEEIADSDLNYFISGCGDLNEYVIGLQKTEYAYLGSLRKFGSLVLNNNDFDNVKSLAALIEMMEKEYQDLLNAGCFSKNYETGEWSGFSKEDLIFIESVG